MDVTGHDLFAGRYVLRGLLGAGGMAEVRDAWDTRLNRAVAIKLLHPAMKAQPETLDRFRDEARSAAMLSHPNIVAVHDYGEQDGTPFIVMERLPGQTLADVTAHGPMPPDRVRSMLDEVLAALTVAHSAGVLHRDIKPANILVSATGDSFTVADFGIAKAGGAAAHTMTGHIVGTMAYMSPERVGGAAASAADDLYAVGVVGYEAIVGHRAFPQDTPVAVARAIMDDPPRPLREIRPDLDPSLAGTIDRAMARDPGRRFRDAAHMRAALNGDPQALFAGAAPATAAPPRPATRVLEQPLPPSAHYVMPPPAPSRWRRLPGRTRKAIFAAAILACLTIAGLAVAADPFSTAPSTGPAGTSTTPAPTSSSAPASSAPSSVVQQPPQEPGGKKDKEEKKREQEEKKRGGGNGP
ncbi:protein kinase [Mycobacterium sp. IS-1496]|nr:protein kinase [Mycobacterium sp. IS-1496]